MWENSLMSNLQNTNVMDLRTDFGGDDKGQDVDLVSDSTKRKSPVLNEEDSKIIFKDKLPEALEPKDPAALFELNEETLKEVPLPKTSRQKLLEEEPFKEFLSLTKKKEIENQRKSETSKEVPLPKMCLQKLLMVPPHIEILLLPKKEEVENQRKSETLKEVPLPKTSLQKLLMVPPHLEFFPLPKDEKDIEITRPFEIKSIPSDVSFSPSLPPENRFVCKRPALFHSLIRKKGNKKICQSPKSAASESSGIGESESQGTLVSNAGSSVSSAGMKENPSFDEQMDQGSPSASKDDRDEDLGQCHDSAVALRSSFSKYLEKKLESEWLATGQSSEQPKPSENISRK